MGLMVESLTAAATASSVPSSGSSPPSMSGTTLTRPSIFRRTVTLTLSLSASASPSVMASRLSSYSHVNPVLWPSTVSSASGSSRSPPTKAMPSWTSHAIVSSYSSENAATSTMPGSAVMAQ